MPSPVVPSSDPFPSARSLQTRSQVFGYALALPSTRLLLGLVVAVVVLRLLLAQTTSAVPGVADGVAVVLSMLAVGPVEWFVHRHLFHAPEWSRRSTRLGTGRDHRKHHAEPDDLSKILLAPRAVVLLAAPLSVLVALWAVPVGLAFGSGLAGVAGAYLSAVIVAVGALTHYELTHLLIHSGYLPRSRYYRRLARHHRLHHHRNPGARFGITSTLGDRLAGTLP